MVLISCALKYNYKHTSSHVWIFLKGRMWDPFYLHLHSSSYSIIINSPTTVTE